MRFYCGDESLQREQQKLKFCANGTGLNGKSGVPPKAICLLRKISSRFARSICISTGRTEKFGYTVNGKCQSNHVPGTGDKKPSGEGVGGGGIVVNTPSHFMLGIL